MERADISEKEFGLHDNQRKIPYFIFPDSFGTQ
jgi:hypothetical protein